MVTSKAYILIFFFIFLIFLFYIFFLDLKINYNGDDIEIGFNSKYIMDIVNNLEDEEISINLKDNTSPIIATENSNSNLVYVLMPMRV